MLAKKTFKNQITIPKQIISRFPNVQYFEVITRNDEIILKPAEIVSRSSKVSNLREKIKSLSIGENTIEEAIRWARKKSHH